MMSDFTDQWPQHLRSREERAENPGFGIAGLVATGTVLAVLAGFGAIAVVAGSGPKGTGHEIPGHAIAQTVTGAVGEAGPAEKPDPKISGSERSPVRVGGAGVAHASHDTQQPDATRTEPPTPAPTGDRAHEAAQGGSLAQEYAGLEKNDPRWAQDVDQPVANGEQALARLLLNERAEPENVADKALTAAMAPADRRGPEGQASQQTRSHSSGKAAQESGRAGHARQYVNMRAGPDNDARVLKVVPAKARLIIHGCNGWCEVSHDGQRGFVYKTFIERG